MMEAEAAGKSMMEAEAVRQPAEAEIMLLPAAEAEIIDLVPLLKARIFPRARSLVPYKHIILYLVLSSHTLTSHYGCPRTPSKCQGVLGSILSPSREARKDCYDFPSLQIRKC